MKYLFVFLLFVGCLPKVDSDIDKEYPTEEHPTIKYQVVVHSCGIVDIYCASYATCERGICSWGRGKEPDWSTNAQNKSNASTLITELTTKEEQDECQDRTTLLETYLHYRSK